MATVELQRQERAAPEAARWYGRAFGMALASWHPFPGVQPLDVPGERMAVWSEVTAEVVEQAFDAHDAATLLERRHPDGRLFLRVEGSEPRGYRIWAPYYGRHLVGADGRSIESALPRVPPVRWQRLFFAQVLPLAAALNGLSLFHASAVAIDGRAIAFIGPPGSGKTSLTAHLVALGASFVTDDVLALELQASRVIAHPGPRRLSLDEAELRRIPSTQEVRVGPCVGRSDKLMLEPAPVATALPVARLYFLRPEPEAERIGIAEREAPAGRSLLGSRFLSYLEASEYLERNLEICAALDAAVPPYDITMPRSCRARDMAARVLAHDASLA